MPAATLSAHAVRNPGKSVIPVRVRPRTHVSEAAKASKELKAALAKDRKIALEDDVDAFFAFRASEVTRISTKHSVKEEMVRKMLCNTTQLKTTRGPNLRNAIIHDLALKTRAAGDTKVLTDLQMGLTDAVDEGELTVDPDLLDDAEKKRLLDQLVAYRNTQKRGARATNKAAAMDGMQVAHRVRDMLLDLFERTGIRGIALFTRGNPDDEALPHGVDSDDSLDFFQEELGISFLDALRSFERYSCTLDNGAQDPNGVARVRKQAGKLIRDTLRVAVNNKKVNMSYENYDYTIRQLLKVQLLGWPTDIAFGRPSQLLATDVRKIRDGLRDGSIRWHRMTSKDHAELVKKNAAEPARMRATRSDKGTKRGPQKAKAKATDETDNSDNDSDDSSDKDADEEEDAAIPSTPHAARTAGAPAASTALADAAPATPAGWAAGPALDDFDHTTPDPSAFDFSSFDSLDFSRMPTLNLDTYAFDNTGGGGGSTTEDPDFPSWVFGNAPPPPGPNPSSGGVPAVRIEPAPTTITHIVAHGVPSSSTSVFAVSANGAPTKKRKGDVQGGGAPKKGRKSAPDSSSATAPKERKVRSDKGMPRKPIDENAPPRERKVRSDKGKSRKRADA
ncbi:hypothetical protein FB451DRAFT_1292519 [Mycena latifolia]|nr:hypothetical protein FB451DRAFT_1292519 [Mycena latifolia]